MNLSKLLPKPHRIFFPLPSHSLSTLTSTESTLASDQRRRKRQLRMQPPISSHRSSPPPPRQAQSQTPPGPKLPDHIFTLTGPKLNLHNKILKHIHENDLSEAALYTRHSVYSNCRPTIFTVNAVLTALLRMAKYTEFLSLHRFITQAGISANIVTYNLLIKLYLECRKPDTALEHYKRLIEDAPFEPNLESCRVLVKGLVDNGRVEKAVEVRDEMVGRGVGEGDEVVCAWLMNGFAEVEKDGGRVVELYEELKGRKGEVRNGIVFGPLMKGLFLKGMENEAMEVYEEVLKGGEEEKKVRMDGVGYNLVMEACFKNGRFDEAVMLFDRMKSLHNPPWKGTVNLGSYNVLVDGFCGEGRFEEAVEVFMSMGEMNVSPDVLSFNNLIGKLCENGLVEKAEEVCGRMEEKGVSQDEVTYGLLMDACFKASRPDDAAGYFRKMVDSELRPNLAVYNRLVEGLVNVGKIDEAKSFFDLMVQKLKFNSASYEYMFKVLCDDGRVDDVLNVVSDMLDEGSVDLNEDMHKIVKDGLKSLGREEEELDRLIEQKENEKQEAKIKEAEEAAKAKASASKLVSSLIPTTSRLFGNKEEAKESTVSDGGQGPRVSSPAGVDAGTVAEANSASEPEFKSADHTQAAA